MARSRPDALLDPDRDLRPDAPNGVLPWAADLVAGWPTDRRERVATRARLLLRAGLAVFLSLTALFVLLPAPDGLASRLVTGARWASLLSLLTGASLRALLGVVLTDTGSRSPDTIPYDPDADPEAVAPAPDDTTTDGAGTDDTTPAAARLGPLVVRGDSLRVEGDRTLTHAGASLGAVFLFALRLAAARHPLGTVLYIGVARPTLAATDLDPGVPRWRRRLRRSLLAYAAVLVAITGAQALPALAQGGLIPRPDRSGSVDPVTLPALDPASPTGGLLPALGPGGWLAVAVAAALLGSVVGLAAAVARDT